MQQTPIAACDPGIANTAIAVVRNKAQAYQLLKTELITSGPTQPEPER